MRNLNTRRYVLAAIITLGIFLLGLLLGLVIEGKRVGHIDVVSKRQNLDFSSLQLQYAFIDQMSQEKNCAAVQKTFEQNINTLESTRIKLEGFDASASSINKEEFDMLRAEYILAQIRYWLLAERTKRICGSDFVTVLYFFTDQKECPDCDRQSFILTYLKKRFEDRILVFSFYSKFSQEPMIPLLMSTYNVTSYPSVVIEGEVFNGFIDKDRLLEEICPHYDDKPQDCKK